MLVDIQGKNTLLSDPTFHTQPETLFDDSTNRGSRGINEFFESQHSKCSTLCKSLKLERITETLLIN